MGLDVPKDIAVKQLEAIWMFLNGKPYSSSTDISGAISYGYGALSDYGFWEYQLPVALVKMRRKLFLLRELSFGCTTHPAYRAHKSPSCDCVRCATLREYKLELEELDKEYGR